MYLLDADVFIEAKDTYFAMDFCPGFWDWLVHAHHQGRLFSIDRVRAELLAGDDELSEWVKRIPRSFFLKPASNTTESLRVIADWTSRSDHYEQDAKAAFLARADYYLVAPAHERGYAVVTNEKATESKRQIKIPNACAPHGVPVRTLFEVLRAEPVQLVASFGS